MDTYCPAPGYWKVIAFWIPRPSHRDRVGRDRIQAVRFASPGPALGRYGDRQCCRGGMPFTLARPGQVFEPDCWPSVDIPFPGRTGSIDLDDSCPCPSHFGAGKAKPREISKEMANPLCKESCKPPSLNSRGDLLNWQTWTMVAWHSAGKAQVRSVLRQSTWMPVAALENIFSPLEDWCNHPA